MKKTLEYILMKTSSDYELLDHNEFDKFKFTNKAIFTSTNVAYKFLSAGAFGAYTAASVSEVLGYSLFYTCVILGGLAGVATAAVTAPVALAMDGVRNIAHKAKPYSSSSYTLSATDSASSLKFATMQASVLQRSFTAEQAELEMDPRSSSEFQSKPSNGCKLTF